MPNPATPTQSPLADLLTRPSKSVEDYLEIQRAAFAGSRDLRALEKHIEPYRAALEAGETLDAGAALDHAVLLSLLGRFEEAIDLLAGNEDPVAVFFRARARKAVGHYMAAAQDLATLSPDLRVATELVEAHLATGQVEAAQQVVAAACEGSAGQKPAALYMQGLLKDAQGEHAAAAELLGAAVEKDPGLGAARFQLARIADRHGDDDLARQQYEILAAECPTHVNALLNLGILYEDADQYDRAMECYERVLDLYPTHPRARHYLVDARESLDMVVDEDQDRRDEALTQKLRTPISDFELSVRSRNCLAKMNINLLGDLVQKTQAELMAYRNFGETSLGEVKEILRSKGLRLGMHLDSPEVARLVRAMNREQEKFPEEQNTEILEKAIDFLELSVRSRKCMDRLGINTVGELIQTSEAELLRVKNFGSTSINEVRQKLAAYGLKLKES